MSNSSKPKRNRSRRGAGREAPPKIHANIRGYHRQRYVAGSALTNTAITGDQLVCMLSMATSAATANSVIGSARLVSVELWGPPGTTTPVTVSVEYGGTDQFAANKVYSDTSIGATHPAHVRASPDPGQGPAWWTGTGGNLNLFYLNGPSGTIVDVTIEYVVNTMATHADTTTFSITGGTAGRSFVRALDGAGGILVPVSSLNYVG